MLDFVQNAPKSSLCIVYFNTKEQPIVIEQLATITLPSGQYYMSCGPRGLWSFTYRVADIRHLIYRNKTDVHAFMGHELFEINGGGRFDMAGIGNHITVALKNQKDNILIYTHLTNYSERFDKDGRYVFDIDHSPHYNFIFEDTLNKNANLIPNKYVKKGTLTSAYQDEPHWLDVIAEIHGVYQGRTKVQDGGYHTHKGRRYKLHEGSRGGRFIMRNGERKYIKHGGGIDPILQEAAQFMHDRFIKRVIEHYAANLDEVDAKLLFDADDSEQVVLIYDMPNVGTRRMYYLGVKEILADARTAAEYPGKAPAIQEKYDAMCTVHIQGIETM